MGYESRGRASAILHRQIWQGCHFGSLEGLARETEPSTLFLSIPLLKMANGRPIRRRFAFNRSRRSCFAVSSDVSLLTEKCRTNRGELLAQTNLFWAISETLYPSRLLSFRSKPSLCLASLKRRVLATPKTSKTEVIREQQARHRDIAALLARGVIRVKRNPLAAKVIESHMPDNKAYSAEQPSQGESMQADYQSQGQVESKAPIQQGGDHEPKRVTRNRRAAGQNG